MQSDLHQAYFNLCSNGHFSGVAPVGDAFLRTVEDGLADPNPYDGISPGTINLWAPDEHHASVEGSYLSTVVLFAVITGLDPRTLPTNAGSPAADLGVRPTTASVLHRIAYDVAGNCLADAQPANSLPPAVGISTRTTSQN